MSTPFELTDEQAEELQVLASIYEDRFEHVCLNPATVRVEIKGAGVSKPFLLAVPTGAPAFSPEKVPSC